MTNTKGVGMDGQVYNKITAEDVSKAFRKLERINQLQKEQRFPGVGEHPHNKVNGLLDLIEYTKPRSVLEIGSFVGVSTEVFCLTTDKVVNVDPHITKEFLDRTKDYTNLTTINGYSPADLSPLEDNTFDLVYIDGGHTYEDVKADILGSFRLVKEDGWISGHDFSMYQDSDGVIQAVRELLGEPKVFGDTSWCIRKDKCLLNTKQSVTS